MTAIIAFAVLNSLFRLAVTVILMFKLVCFRDTFNHLERAGMSIAAGTSCLTIPVIFDIKNTGTPLDGWAATAFTFGVLIYFFGRLVRLRAHAAANREMNHDARKHLSERSKL
jgi:uncharacterized membrane protein (DUF441 family)